jgi:maltose-binding protein MalE
MKAGSSLLLLCVLAAACAAPVPTPSATAAPTPIPGSSATPTVPTSTTIPATATPPPATPTPTAAASPSPTPTVTAAPTPSAPPGATDGTLTIWADAVRANVLSGLAIEFTDSTGTAVQVFEMPFDDIVGQLAALAPADAGPDIFIAAHDRLGELVPAGIVEPLELGEKTTSFKQVALDAFSYDGQLYGMPYLTQGPALIYNRGLLGPSPVPASWSELKSMATTFQAEDPSRQGYCLAQADAYGSYPLLTGFAGYVFGKEVDGSYDAADVGLDTAGGLASAEELDSMVKSGLLRPGVDYSTCLSSMTTGKALFWINGPWAMPDLAASGLDFGVAPIPTMEVAPRPMVGAQGLLVSHYARNRDAALAFMLDLVATDDVMLQLWEADPRLPAWKSVADGISDPNTAAFIASVDGGDPIPAIPQMDAAWPAWTAALNAIFLQQQDAQAAFRDAAEAIRNAGGQ